MSAEPTGYEQFSKLCDQLINEGGYHWLSPEIGRSRATDWMAFIFSRPEKDASRVKLATGQAQTMEEACAMCVADYHERQKIEKRKTELLQNPEVKEALELFAKGAQP